MHEPDRSLSTGDFHLRAMLVDPVQAASVVAEMTSAG
jgi:hypothetical protein